jgi:hypothetical protein
MQEQAEDGRGWVVEGGWWWWWGRGGGVVDGWVIDKKDKKMNKRQGRAITTEENRQTMQCARTSGGRQRVGSSEKLKGVWRVYRWLKNRSRAEEQSGGGWVTIVYYQNFPAQ